MKIKHNLPIYVLSASLVASSVIYSNEASSAPQYVTLQKYKADLKVLATEVVKLRYEVDSLNSCLSQTTQALTMRVQVSRWCP